MIVFIAATPSFVWFLPELHPGVLLHQKTQPLKNYCKKNSAAENRQRWRNS
jgi:hypothetical protein